MVCLPLYILRCGWLFSVFEDKKMVKGQYFNGVYWFLLADCEELGLIADAVVYIFIERMRVLFSDFGNIKALYAYISMRYSGL